MSKKSIVAVSFFLLILGLFWFLKLVFAGSVILPQSFSLGLVTIRYYGITMALAVLVGWFLAQHRLQKLSLEKKTLENFFLSLIVGGFVGARVYHVLSSFGYYVQNPTEIFQVWHGGLSIYGAVFGGIIAFFIYTTKVAKEKFKNVSLMRVLDLITPSILLGQVIGRFGNFFNYEAFGYPTRMPWSMFVPEAFRPGAYIENSFFHPLFLYEAIANFCILIFLLIMEKTRLRFTRPGVVFLAYIFCYNSVRFFLEALRVDSVFIGDFRLNMLTSGALFFVSAVWVLKLLLEKKENE